MFHLFGKLKFGGTFCLCLVAVDRVSVFGDDGGAGGGSRPFGELC